jgi:Stress responsive A/B Barrel Domain
MIRRTVTSLAVISLALALLLVPAVQCAAAGTSVRIVHVVMVWLKEPGNAAQRARVIEATRGFASIPGVMEIRVGEPLPSQRATVDDSFDVGLYMTFSSQEALEGYLTNPEHQAAQETVLRPLVKRVLIYDFRDDGA